MGIGTVTPDIFSFVTNTMLVFRDAAGKSITCHAQILLGFGEMIMLQPDDKSVMNFVRIHKKVTLMCFSDKESCKYIAETKIIDIRLEPPLITVAKPKDIEMGLRRRHFRCEVLLDFRYTLNFKTFPGQVTNLSESGLWAVVDENIELSVRSSLKCELFLPTSKNPLYLTGRVVRIQDISQPHKQGFAMEFQDLVESTSDEIVKYLFQKQREILKLRKRDE